MFEHVLSPGRIGSLKVGNRIVMGAMHLGLEARDADGGALAAFYARRAAGPGLIVTGGSAVSRAGAGGPGYSLVNDAAHGARLACVARAVHDAGGRIALQLFHAGRYALPGAFGLTPVAPSAVYSAFSRCEPREMTETEIEATLEDFGAGAATARELGFDAVEVMGSEGYLINQFLSPLTNRRQDRWGGDPERRMRFGLEVLRSIRERVGPDYPVLYRVSAADLVEGSTPAADAMAFAARLAEEGADALDAGIGWHESRVPTVQGTVPPAAWAPWARNLRRVAGGTPVIACNRVNRLEIADAIVAGGDADFVAMARPLLADPDLIARSRSGRPHAVNVCIACNQACIDRSFDDGPPVSCMVNPEAGHERETAGRARRPGRMAVVGGGPAGMEAALRLARDGHRVDLFEGEEELGGQFRLARLVPGKEDYGETIRHFTAELTRLGVHLHLGRRIGPGDAALLAGYDGVVLATGVVPRRIQVPGSDLAHVLSYADAFDAPLDGATVAIVGGGGIGVDLAHRLSHGTSSLPPERRFLREHGLEGGGVPVSSRGRVTVLQRGPRLAPGVGRSTRWVTLAALRRQGVETLTQVRCEEIQETRIRAVDGEGRSRLIPVDRVVVAVGQEPAAALREVIEPTGVPLRLAGGARGVRGLNAVRAFAEGLEAARELGAAVAARGAP